MSEKKSHDTVICALFLSQADCLGYIKIQESLRPVNCPK